MFCHKSWMMKLEGSVDSDEKDQNKVMKSYLED